MDQNFSRFFCDLRKEGFWTSQNDKEKKDPGQARMTRRRRILSGRDRLSQNGQEVHALCDLSFPLVGNPSHP